MKPNTIKYMCRVRETWEGSAVDGPMIRASCDAIESLARRLSKLERAGRVTPERKQVQEEFPRMDTSVYYSSNMSVDVLLTLRDLNGREFKIVGYWTYRQKKWMMYNEDGNGVEMRVPIVSWQYITDPATTPPTIAPSAWVSVKESLPERDLGDCSITVKVMDASGKVYKAFYNYDERYWTRTDTPLFSFNDVVPVKWKLLE